MQIHRWHCVSLTGNCDSATAVDNSAAVAHMVECVVLQSSPVKVSLSKIPCECMNVISDAKALSAEWWVDQKGAV